jgi:hypothetical protein
MAAPITTPSRDRPRFARFRIERLANGRCRAEVVLSWQEKGRIRGAAEGIASPSGELRCAAQACLNALAQAVREPAFEVLGVKAVRAFDENVVIVSLAMRGLESGPRLVGSCLSGDRLARGAAVAVLNATNRIIAKPAVA